MAVLHARVANERRVPTLAARHPSRRPRRAGLRRRGPDLRTGGESATPVVVLAQDLGARRASRWNSGRARCRWSCSLPVGRRRRRRTSARSSPTSWSGLDGLRCRSSTATSTGEGASGRSGPPTRNAPVPDLSSWSDAALSAELLECSARVERGPGRAARGRGRVAGPPGLGGRRCELCGVVVDGARGDDPSGGDAAVSCSQVGARTRADGHGARGRRRDRRARRGAGDRGEASGGVVSGTRAHAPRHGAHVEPRGSRDRGEAVAGVGRRSAGCARRAHLRTRTATSTCRRPSAVRASTASWIRSAPPP